jgi:hypothetical protein
MQAQPNEQPEQIAVLLTQRQAYTASVALVDELQRQIEYLTGEDHLNLDEVHMGGIGSKDAQSTARGLSHVLNTLDAIGWPHKHWRDEYRGNLSELEAIGRSSWGER